MDVRRIENPPTTLISPEATVLQKLVVVTSHIYIPAFGLLKLLFQLVLHLVVVASIMCIPTGCLKKCPMAMFSLNLFQKSKYTFLLAILILKHMCKRIIGLL